MKQRNHKRFTLILAGLMMIALSPVISVHVYAVDFTIIVLPDTQTYSEYYPEIFQSQTQWIAENKDTLNIVYVAHEGDIVEHSENESEWIRADSAMSLLDAAMIPYGVVPGNHDEPTTFYNEYFGVDRFCNTYPTDCRSYYGDGYPAGSNDSNYTRFSAGGMDFIVINLDYVNPAAGVLDWADQLLKDNIDRRAIVVSHYILNSNATFGSWGQQIYDTLKDNPNLFLMLCGHIHAEARRTDGTLHTLLADFQDYPNGGNGFLRILHFSPEKNEIQVDTYSPWLNQYETDSNSQFVLPYDMGGLSALNTISFQDGVSPGPSYFGTIDTVLSQNEPNTNFGNDFSLYVNGDDPPGSGDDLSTLLYWDISSIPIGSIVEEVSIALNVFNASNHSYQVHEMKRDWAESESSWNICSSGQGWEIPGALGSQDSGSTVLGSFFPNATGTDVINLNSEGVALIQSWVDNPSGNHGLIIRNSSTTDGSEFDSREVETMSNRPKLTVFYTDEDTDADSLSYTPVTPCRIADTRKAWGALSPGGIFSYNVWGAVASQGGNPAECPSPGGEPHAVHLSVAAVPVAGQGHLRLFPFNTPAPNASALSYKTGSNIANAITVKTCYLCTKDVNIQSFGGTTHVVIDVMGYYYSIPTLSEAIYSPITGHWYQLNDKRMEWNEAKTFAESRGGYLATITSAAEGQWLYDTFGSALRIDSGMRTFGGNDVANEGQWQWITGEAWSYSNWWAGEPNDNGGNEDCVAFSSNLNPGHGHYWNDVPTDVEYRSLIEYNSNPN